MRLAWRGLCWVNRAKKVPRDQHIEAISGAKARRLPREGGREGQQRSYISAKIICQDIDVVLRCVQNWARVVRLGGDRRWIS